MPSPQAVSLARESVCRFGMIAALPMTVILLDIRVWTLGWHLVGVGSSLMEDLASCQTIHVPFSRILYSEGGVRRLRGRCWKEADQYE